MYGIVLGINLLFYRCFQRINLQYLRITVNLRNGVSLSRFPFIRPVIFTCPPGLITTRAKITPGHHKHLPMFIIYKIDAVFSVMRWCQAHSGRRRSAWTCSAGPCGPHTVGQGTWPDHWRATAGEGAFQLKKHMWDPLVARKVGRKVEGSRRPETRVLRAGSEGQWEDDKRGRGRGQHSKLLTPHNS